MIIFWGENTMKLSDDIMLTLEENENICFTTNCSMKEPCFPTQQQINKKIIGLRLSYAWSKDQDWGIDLIKAAFGTSKDGVIKKIPENLLVGEIDRGEVYAIKYGYSFIPYQMIEQTLQCGMTGAWDNNNFAICATERYKPIIKGIEELLKSGKAKFAVAYGLGAPDFMIVKN